VLKNVSLIMQPGEVVALVGETGAGKTTVTNLLTRLYRVDSGEILIDGEPLDSYTNEELRRAIAVVPQDTYLFPGTIEDNIAYGTPDASPEEIRASARAVSAHEFISRLPEGYETEVGEEGGLLSGGQKQLLALARALLTDPVILILDEATSSVDAVTEAAIRDALDTVLEGRTAVIIAHRFSTLKAADKICVMADGRLEAVGTHQQLWERSDEYRQLCASQWPAEHEGVRG